MNFDQPQAQAPLSGPPPFQRYARYNERGLIVAFITIPEDMEPPFFEMVLVGEEVSAQTHMVDPISRKVLELSPEEAAFYINRPSYPAQWDPARREWVDLRSLDQVKADAWREIKEARHEAEFSTFEALGHEFDCDSLSVSRLMGAIQLAQLSLSLNEPFAIEWTLADNTTVNLSALQLLEVGKALGIHVNAQHIKARALRGAVDAATDIATVKAIRW
jgi:hypothetical protein